MRKLIIDGHIADLPTGELIALTKETNSLWDIKDKRSNLSNTIILPYSQTNNIIFNNAKDPTVTDTTFRNFHDVIYVQDFVEIISTGKLKLVKAGVDGYEVVILWGNVELTDILGTKTLQDLDLADLNHIWNDENVRALYVPTAPIFECVYPFYNPSSVEADFFNAGTLADPELSMWFIPFVQLNRLIRQIAIDNNLQFVGGIENVDNYAYIPVATNEFNPDYNVEASFLQRDITGTPDFIIGIGNWLDLVAILPDNIITDLTGVFTGGIFKSPETATYIFNLNLKIFCGFSKEYYENNAEFSLDCTIWGQTSNDGINWVTVFTKVFDQIIVDELNSYDLDLSGINFQYSIPVNTYFRFYSEFYGGNISNTNGILFYHTPQTTYTITADKMTFGNTWNIARNLPDIKQIDLLKYACTLGGYIFEKKENINEIHFHKYDDIITSTDVQDLSDYLDHYEINDFHAQLSQSNRLKYTNDETVKETLGDGFIIVEDDTLEKLQTIYEAPFGATEMQSFTTPTPSTIQIAHIPLLNDDLTWIKLSPRIVHCRAITLNVYYRHLSVSNLVQTKFVAQFTAADLVFSNVINKSYQAYSETVNDYKDISAWVYLTAARFYDLDLSRPAFFKQLGAKFIIQKVKDFVKGKITELQLIKIK